MATAAETSEDTAGLSQTVKAQLRLRELIVGGVLKPGQRIAELALVERIGVSRTPIRMALVRLQEEGLLEALPSGGFMVKDFSEEDIRDAIELRGTLEGLAARLAAERGVRIYTVGIGSTAGTTLHVNGFTVHTALNEEMLQQIAQITEGAYYNAESQQDLRAIYENLGLQLVIKPEDTEITALFAGAGMLILLIGGMCSMLWLGRMP